MAQSADMTAGSKRVPFAMRSKVIATPNPNPNEKFPPGVGLTNSFSSVKRWNDFASGWKLGWTASDANSLRLEIEQLRTDPRTIEAAARSRLTMVRANEIVIPVE